MKKRKKRIDVVRERWAEEAIRRAERAVQRKQKHDVFVSRLVFWSSIVVVVIANLLSAIVIIPFIAILSVWFVYFVVVVVALVMGFLYNFLIMDIGYLGRKHHIWAGIIIPVIAVVNVVVMIGVANQLIGILQIETVRQNPWFIGVSYGVAFITPYLIDRIRVAKGKRPLLKSF